MSIKDEFYQGIMEDHSTLSVGPGAVSDTGNNNLWPQWHGNGIGHDICPSSFSNLFVSLLRRFIPSQVRIASFIVIIASFVVIVELVMQAYFYPLFKILGIFIPLIVVNCIILGRAEAFASKQGPIASLADGLGIGLGFTISLFVLGCLRELLGNGTLLDIPVMWSGFEPFAFMLKPPGAFVALGILLAAMNLISQMQARKGGGR